MKGNRKRASAISGVLCMLSLAVTGAIQTRAQERLAQAQVLSNAVENEPIHFDVSPPLRDLPVEVSPQGGIRLIHPPLRPKLKKLQEAAQQGASADSAVLQASPSSPISPPTIGLNFDGVAMTSSTDLGSTLNCGNLLGFPTAPPDTNMAVGDTQVVQWVNLCYAVFDKATGALIAGPFPGNHFWAGFTVDACATANDGDPIIQWDKANHVWVASQIFFKFGRLGGPFGTCVAVSRTADATGSYNRYAFAQSAFPDYPKWGLTPSVYYQTQNAFGPFFRFLGVNVCAYDGVAMRAGTNAKQICILDNSNGTLFDDSMLPADLDSTTASTASIPEVLLGSIDNFNPGSNIYEYVFTVNFKNPALSTLAGVNGTMPIAVPTYSLACGLFFFCVPQPGVPDLLEVFGDRLMYRLARFDDGTNQHFLVTHDVNNTTAVAERWYEFTAPEGSTSLTLAQSGETTDDGEFRWMGSIARDKFGDIALGYSRSSGAAGDYPSLYLSGQTAGEAPGTTDAETLIFHGSGSQTDTFGGRWGDYSSMALDGADGCTFWYTTEYYPATGAVAWNTRIAGQIRFKSCQ